MVKKNYDDMLSRFHLIPERYGRTDGQTDRFAISISRVSMLTRDKNTIERINDDEVTPLLRHIAFLSRLQASILLILSRSRFSIATT